jgi:hypothetical protein
MSKLRIDADDLILAMTVDPAFDTTHYLDLRTGAVIAVFGDDFADEDPDAIAPQVDAEPERFRMLDTIPPREAFGWMERFASSQEDPATRDRLLDALDRPRPFRSFKDALFEFPAVREAWFRFEEERQIEYVRDWLRFEGIEAELEQQPASSGADAAPPA